MTKQYRVDEVCQYFPGTTAVEIQAPDAEQPTPYFRLSLRDYLQTFLQGVDLFQNMRLPSVEKTIPENFILYFPQTLPVLPNGKNVMLPGGFNIYFGAEINHEVGIFGVDQANPFSFEQPPTLTMMAQGIHRYEADEHQFFLRPLAEATHAIVLTYWQPQYAPQIESLDRFSEKYEIVRSRYTKPSTKPTDIYGFNFWAIRYSENTAIYRCLQKADFSIQQILNRPPEPNLQTAARQLEQEMFRFKLRQRGIEEMLEQIPSWKFEYGDRGAKLLCHDMHGGVASIDHIAYSKGGLDVLEDLATEFLDGSLVLEEFFREHPPEGQS